MFIPTRNYGKFGFINDLPAHQLPIGAWNRARNVRFAGGYISKLLEPLAFNPSPPPNDIMWAQQFFDGGIVRLVVATPTSLWIVAGDGNSWVDVSREGGYTPTEGGYWQSFAFGRTCVFNNGVDKPQVYDLDADQFIDLPNWGVITKDDGTENHQTNANARFIVPYKNFLVAGNVVEDIDGVADSVQPNTVWWSSAILTPDLWKDLGQIWDYNSPENLSGKTQIEPEEGPLQWGAPLGEALILYTSSSSTQMLLTGGPLVMDFRRILDYGCTGLYCAAPFRNMHYVIGPDVMYIHDGNTIVQVAEDRVRDWFYRNIKNIESTCRVVTDYTKREVLIQFDAIPDEFVGITPNPMRIALVYNYEDDNFSVYDAAVDLDATNVDNQVLGLSPVVCMVYGLDLGERTGAGNVWDATQGEWDGFGETRWNELSGGAAAQAVSVTTFWVTATDVYRADLASQSAPNKSFRVRKTNIDLDEMDPQMTTNLWKHLRQMYPHIVGDGQMRVRFGWSRNLEIAPTWGEWIDFRMLSEGGDPAMVDTKIDTRTTGRYLAMEFDFADVRFMRFSGADIDVIPVYGR